MQEQIANDDMRRVPESLQEIAAAIVEVEPLRSAGAFKLREPLMREVVGENLGHVGDPFAEAFELVDAHFNWVIMVFLLRKVLGLICVEKNSGHHLHFCLR